MNDKFSMNFIPSDKKLFGKLMDRFQYLFDPELINEMVSCGHVSKFKEYDILIDIGQTISHMPLVLSGSIKIMTEDKDGNELLLYYLELGDTCAVTLNCCTKASKSSIRAISESFSEVLLIPIEKMEEWMGKYPKWRNFVLESFNTRLEEMFDAIDNLAFNNMEERLTNYLKDKVWITKSETLIISHYQIANDLNSSRVVISRLMKKLENDQKIIQHRNKVEILNFTSL